MANSQNTGEPGATHGIVKWFDDGKGYGFITPDGGGEDVFVHFTGIATPGKGRKNLEDTQRVRFNVVATDKGQQAVDVTLEA